MAEFTLLKIQLDESSFTANAPFSGGESETAETSAEPSEEGGGRGGTVLTALAALFVLALLAVLVKKWRGREAGEESEGELVELDDIDV